MKDILDLLQEIAINNTNIPCYINNAPTEATKRNFIVVRATNADEEREPDFCGETYEKEYAYYLFSGQANDEDVNYDDVESLENAIDELFVRTAKHQVINAKTNFSDYVGIDKEQTNKTYMIKFIMHLQRL